MTQENDTAPHIERVRHETKRRILKVEKIEDVTPLMRRVFVGGDDLTGFVSAAPDDHIKLFFGENELTQQSREYTPRFYDEQANLLAIDFVLHDAGPASTFALNAKQGDELVIGGPRGSAVIGGNINAWLLIGDETALPAIGRRVEEAAEGTDITVIATVANEQEVQKFNTKANVTYHWVYRSVELADEPKFLLEKVKELSLQERTFIWIAAEGKVTRHLRMFFNTERHVPLNWIKAAGYWVKGFANSKEKFD
ncbi:MULTISPECIES: siderophore-interacting protein [unclassified Bartonella]|uniref:siderophore-interacting protein n=1 Tax=unclassified Bartonella TaxID=2645622 RepID=UPI0015F79279|nr:MULTISPECIES: siderophore-interacting protein [unclassified Bartonella]UXN02555.1 siderophore-interacting protein [Bartonella sp. HY406]UXN05526.1 siderophore-interacting protein [Bartonella sp. HY761]